MAVEVIKSYSKSIAIKFAIDDIAKSNKLIQPNLKGIPELTIQKRAMHRNARGVKYLKYFLTSPSIAVIPKGVLASRTNIIEIETFLHSIIVSLLSIFRFRRDNEKDG